MISILSNKGVGRVRRALSISGRPRWNRFVRDLTARLG